MAPEKLPIRERLQEHFGNRAPEDIVTSARVYALASRIDLQLAVDAFFEIRPTPIVLGILGQGFMGEPVGLAQLFGQRKFEIGPLQHEDVDTGSPVRTRCLKNALWLANEDGLPFALTMMTARRGVGQNVHFELATPKGEAGTRFSEDFFRNLEVQVNRGGAYRGKVISLEAPAGIWGEGATIRVHQLHRVTREEVILPEKTLRLLDHNVSDFIRAREHLKKMGLSGKKGLLFYGPPGTGKTHTVYYLASHLSGHTTLLVTAEQVLLVDEYFRLARLLQPSVIVVEDVDLIARSRDQFGGSGSEVFLNKLLNEMDGLREDADVLFVLTTNRADQLERALASRPGRIDQAIEFPLPDEPGRARLALLYSRGLQVDSELLESIVRKTRGASAAFIKELMRRAAQFQFELGTQRTLDMKALDAAMEEMVFNGGPLNLKVLGGGNVEIGFTGGGKGRSG